MPGPSTNSRACALTALTLTLLGVICGCGSRPRLQLSVPPLPQEARQPETPSECLPTCLIGLTRARKSWLNTPTGPASPAQPASAPMTR